jgi:hypothetical protein
MVMIGGVDYSEVELKALEKAGVLQIAQKHDPGSTTLTAAPLHGAFHGAPTQFGIFSTPGVKPQRFNATPRPQSIMNLIPFRKSDLINEIIEIVTGVTAGAGNNATTFCGNPPVYGQLKTCQQAYTFGRIFFGTRLNDLTQIGQRKNRADIPAEILNDAMTNNPLLPQVPGIQAIGDTMSQLRTEFYTAGVGLEREAVQVNWSGTQGTENNTYRGIMTQWSGLDNQIKTGYTDAVNGLACSAADSVVSSFNTSITGTDSNSLDFVEASHDVYNALKQRAKRVGLSVAWVIVMREEHFIRATDAWACAYSTYRCSGAQYAEQNTDAMQTQALRIQMLQGQYLLFDGVQVPVQFDDGIPREVVANNTYKSDMYFVPLSADGIPTLYYDYFDMENAYSREFAEFVGGTNTRVINGGLYLVGKRETPFCQEYQFAAKLRLILEAPFLAGRLDDTQYTFFQKIRDSIPGQSFYANGGVTYRS